MIFCIKKILKSLVNGFVQLLNKVKVGGYILDLVLNSLMQLTLSVKYKEVSLKFSTPNQLNRYRVASFSDKEPETLEWIDGFRRGSVLWDIGANIGLYSCYAAKSRNCKVIAFEPSVFNLELLARNIFLNNLTKNVVMMPLPISDKLEVSRFSMTSIEWGGALSTFGKDYGWDGRKINDIFQYETIGLSADEAISFFQLPPPNHLKIDVDGIEHLILSGAKNVISKVESVLIEVNDDFIEQSENCSKLLLEAGLVMREKRHSEIFEGDASFGGGKVWNQIWVRV
jgi:FkbM family methyltransferase